MYKTLYGAIISALIISLGFTYLAILTKTLLLKEQIEVKTSTIINNELSNPELIEIGKSGMSLAFKLQTANGADLFTENPFVKVTINQVIQIWTEIGGVRVPSRLKIPILLKKWGDGFRYENQDEVKRLGIDEYYCPTVNNYTIQGNFYSDAFRYLEIRAVRCMDWGKTVAEIDAYVKSAKFEIASVNTYVDIKSFDKPLKQMIQDGLFWNISPGFELKSDIYFQKNKLELQDNLVQLYNEETLDYFQYSYKNDYFEGENPSKNRYLSIFIRYDPVENTAYRKVFSLGDMLSQVGGLFEILLMLGSLFVTSLTKSALTSSLLSECYQTQSPCPPNSSAKSELSHRRSLPPNLALKSCVFGLFWCVRAKNREKLDWYRQGVKKLEAELDLGQILKKVRVGEVMGEVFMTDSMRFLAKFQKELVVGEWEVGAGEEDEIEQALKSLEVQNDENAEIYQKFLKCLITQKDPSSLDQNNQSPKFNQIPMSTLSENDSTIRLPYTDSLPKEESKTKPTPPYLQIHPKP